MSHKLDTAKNIKSTYLFINNDSPNFITGTSYNFNYDISKVNLNRTRAHKMYLKDIYFNTNALYQISDKYNYNKVRFYITNGANVIILYGQIQEGNYNTEEFILAFERMLNATLINYGSFSVNYNSITNRLTFSCLTYLIPAARIYIDAQDTEYSYSSIVNSYGFGMSYVLGCNENTRLENELPFNTVPGNLDNNRLMASTLKLTPYNFFYISIDNITNTNASSDVDSVTNLLFRIVVPSLKNSVVYIENFTPEFNEVYTTQMPSSLRIKLVDQYNQPLDGFSGEMSITLKLIEI